VSPGAPIRPTRQASGIPGYDLGAPVRPLLPAWTPPRFDPAEMEANARRAEAEDRAKAARVHRDAETALQEWCEFRDRHFGNPVITAVLDVHGPQYTEDRVACTECMEGDFDSTVPAEWPCRTYDAMQAAAETSKNGRSAPA
jgi:hypothetical protein